MAKAVFLDRDETLNPDSGYINDPNLFHLYPWVPSGLARLKTAGFLLVVVSNQSGVNRGLITEHQLGLIHAKLDTLLFQAADIHIDHYAICPHTPEENCECRKPKPRLILDAAKALNIELSESFMIGDRSSDYEVGVNAKVKKSYLILPGDEASFHSAVQEILSS
jgi:D-glycero-D-manno-heptose 1,7-bisphosphate phosphatase